MGRGESRSDGSSRAAAHGFREATSLASFVGSGVARGDRLTIFWDSFFPVSETSFASQ